MTVPGNSPAYPYPFEDMPQDAHRTGRPSASMPWRRDCVRIWNAWNCRRNFEANIWTGLCAPAIHTRLADLGTVKDGSDGRAFAALLRADLECWTRVAAPLHITLD